MPSSVPASSSHRRRPSIQDNFLHDGLRGGPITAVSSAPFDPRQLSLFYSVIFDAKLRSLRSLPHWISLLGLRCQGATKRLRLTFSATAGGPLSRAGALRAHALPCSGARISA